MPTNFPKVSQVVQEPQESPTTFPDWLREAHHTYSPIDPEAEENRRAINIDFVTQSAPDIRKKL